MTNPGRAAAAVCAPLRSGANLTSGYTVQEHLRRGADLDVYDVWSEERACHCVAKVLRPDRAQARAARARLLAEGRLLERLTHPHIVRAYATIEHPRPLVILETLPGQTLEYLIEEAPGGLPRPDVAYLALHLCSALHYLHGQGYLHLDLKPSNVIATGGVAKLLDLSIARPPGTAPRGMGTPQYMAPEQVRGEPLTPATDAWGLGAVLYEAVSGQPAFALLDRGYEQTRRRAEPLRRRRVPAALAAAVDACLDPDPARRPSIAELTVRLQSLL